MSGGETETIMPEDMMRNRTDASNVPRKAKRAVRASFLPRPEPGESAASVAGLDRFFLQGGIVDAWFEAGPEDGHPDVLMVTFDNATSLGAHEPHQPWLLGRALKLKVSVLGILASQRDWYRNTDAQKILIGLREAGFFERFRRIVFIGTSMGGFAALTLSSLVPGVEVVAFSPQSTLAKDLVPFETRYPAPMKKCNWQDLPLRDAAETLSQAARVWLIYDPFVREDRLHANRLQGDNIERVHFNFAGHRMLRDFRRVEFLSELINGLILGTMDRKAVSLNLRGRRGSDVWQSALLRSGEAKGHLALTAQAARRLFALHPDRSDLRKLAWKLERQARGEPGSSRKERRAGRKGRDLLDGRDTRRVIAHGDLRPPFTGEMLTLHRALVVPERKTGQPHACGVLDSAGTWCPLSKGWIRERKPYLEPALGPREKIVDLPGTHLYAGHFRGHFGHFLVEATARLWALDHLDQPPDSILYLPYRGEVRTIERAIQDLAPFFRLLDIGLPVRTHGSVLRVERLIVPELGFGWGDRYAGSAAYRAFMQRRLHAAAAAEGSDLLYISRSRLNAQRGGILGETVIEENLARLGYEIFHPERHPLEVQVARYKAARRIVALDGSALHLAAYVLPPGARVAMIKRRSRANVDDYLLQFRSFCNVDIDVIDVVRTDWVAEGATRSDYKSVGELDFEALFARLAASGYVPAGFRPDLPDPAGIRALLDQFQDRRGQPFRPLQQNESGPEEED